MRRRASLGSTNADAPEGDEASRAGVWRQRMKPKTFDRGRRARHSRAERRRRSGLQGHSLCRAAGWAVALAAASTGSRVDGRAPYRHLRSEFAAGHRLGRYRPVRGRRFGGLPLSECLDAGPRLAKAPDCRRWSGFTAVDLSPAREPSRATTALITARGVVVVTLNHELNALGFLAHPELTADQVIAPQATMGFSTLLRRLDG